MVVVIDEGTVPPHMSAHLVRHGQCNYTWDGDFCNFGGLSCINTTVLFY